MHSTSNIRGRLVGATLITALAGAPTTAWGLEPQVEGPRERAVPPVEPVRPDMVDMAPADTLQQWSAKQRKLKIQLGVTAGLTAAFLITGALMLVTPMLCRNPSPEWGCGEPYGQWITAMVVIPAGLITAIPTAVYGVRLHRHNLRRPVAQLQVAPGGLTLRF